MQFGYRIRHAPQTADMRNLSLFKIDSVGPVWAKFISEIPTIAFALVYVKAGVLNESSICRLASQNLHRSERG